MCDLMRLDSSSASADTRPVRAPHAVACALCALALGGCGSSGGSVEQAIKSSLVTYYAYTDPAWWGGPVKVETRLLHNSSRAAEATVSVVAHGETVATQTIHLTRTAGNWDVDDSEKTATRPQGYYGTIAGPPAARPPTPAERRRIVSGVLETHPGESGCLRFAIAVSTIDPAFASVTLRAVGADRASCAVDGVLLVGREPDGTWQPQESGRNPFTCHHAPPGVLRSLFGRCWIVNPGVGSNG